MEIIATEELNVSAIFLSKIHIHDIMFSITRVRLDFISICSTSYARQRLRDSKEP